MVLFISSSHRFKYFSSFFLLFCACQQQQIIRGEYQNIKVGYQHQGYNMCVPTSTAIVLSYYGEKISPEKIKALSTPDTSTFAGTFLSDLVKGVKKLGYLWQVRTFSMDSLGFERGFAEIKAALDDGHPILLSTSLPPIGHTMVMVGYDTLHKQIFLMDPNSAFPGNRTISFTVFHKLWHEDIAKVRAFVLTQPKG